LTSAGISGARLDNVLVARGLVRSRANGRDLVRRGFVLVDGVVEFKASRAVTDAHEISLKEDTPQFVSRGAEKLIAALDYFEFPSEGMRVLDIGASTGGFTQVLLKRKAREVYAIDVGRGQLDAALASDPRVHNLEGLDARKISGAEVAAPVDAIVCDVSFISLTKALENVMMLVVRGGWAIMLVKPQFEAGPDAVGSKGIVRDGAVQERVLEEVTSWIGSQSGWRVVGMTQSPIAGGSGNIEFLLGARRDD